MSTTPVADSLKTKFESDLNSLIERAQALATAFGKAKDADSVMRDYQLFYSEAVPVVRVVLPERLDEFIGYYTPAKNRRDVLNVMNYTIQDFLLGFSASRGGEPLFSGKGVAHYKFAQQVLILVSAQRRFSSSLFDIRGLVRAEILDGEVTSARELLRNGFFRAAGVVVGVALERHLAEVCDNHGVKVGKKAPTLADLNDALKSADVYDIAEWRGIQRLADLRNKCAHNKTGEPTKDEATELIDGTEKRLKTLF